MFQRFRFNQNETYDVEIHPAKIAVWEKYSPYSKSTGIFSLFDRERYVSSKTGSSLSSKLRYECLFNNLTQVISRYKSNNKDADIAFRVAECGAGVLNTAQIIARTIYRSKIRSKSFEIYDTFSGLPASDFQPELAHLEGIYSCSLDRFREKMNHYGFVRPIPGLIPESLPQNDNNVYDFVHIDLDLYEGTIGALSHFFPRMKRMGIIQLDDYNSIPWEGVNVAVDEYLMRQDPNLFFFQSIPLGGAYILNLAGSI